jgi:hypothetical protein
VIRAVLGALLPDVLREFSHPVTGLRGLSVDGPYCTDPVSIVHFEDRPLRVLDVGAGYGAWSSEMRRLAQRQGWPVQITGVELKAERERYLRRWCDEVRIGDWQAVLGRGRDVACLASSYLPSVDLAIGNPPFDEITGPKGAKRPPEECMPAVLLRHAPAVLLLHTQQAFARSEAGRASWRHTPPAASWIVPGNVGFRGPGQGNDTRCYQVTLWLRDHTGPCSVYMLDDLPPSARSWSVPPGTEEPSKCESCNGRGTPEDPEEWAGEECGDCHGSGDDPHGDLPAAPGYRP